MPVMRIGKMRMRVRQRIVPMPVHVRTLDRTRMGVLMMRIVDMFMLVLQRLVRVPVQVLFGEMQPHAGCHQCAAGQQRRRDRLVQQRDRDQRADERSGREIGTGARSAQAAQRQYEQHEAGP